MTHSLWVHWRLKLPWHVVNVNYNIISFIFMHIVYFCHCLKLSCKFITIWLTLWGQKATIVTVALIVVNEINFLKMCFEAIHSKRYISPYEWPIASWFSANYSLCICVHLFKYLLLSQMLPIAGFLKRYSRNQTRL